MLNEVHGELSLQMPELVGELSESDSLSGLLSSTETLNGNLGDRQILIESDYEKLRNIPKIEGVPLIGDQTFAQLHMMRLTNSDIEALLQ